MGSSSAHLLPEAVGAPLGRIVDLVCEAHEYASLFGDVEIGPREDIRAMKHVYSRHTVVLSSRMLFASVGCSYAKIAAV
jgi:hypothetical protein